jgi:hypothetical protein
MQTTYTATIAKPLGFDFVQWFSGIFSAKQPVVTADDGRVDNIRALQRMARELEYSQPNLAAELRNFAARS